MTEFMQPDAIRTLFSQAMSEMYREEVPQYGTLIELVRDVNDAALAADPSLRERLDAAGELNRLDVERHGAIRLGTAKELAGVRRMFAVMGMYPVGYYDLSVAGLPVHSTAFRPIASASLARNPFRVFTSLIRLELLEDRALADLASKILAKRQIFTPGALALIEKAETQGGLTAAEAQEFVAEALETFRWHSQATVTEETYVRLHDAHRLIADVVSFKGPHINHLTPRTLDIDAVQTGMPGRGISAKAIIEGPPSRKAAILLRQTSFKALEEAVQFRGSTAAGTHTARFGEIEQRGVALKPAGREMYDRSLAETRAVATVGAKGEGAESYLNVLTERFAAIPDDFDCLRRDNLAYFRYRAVGKVDVTAESVEALIEAGSLIADPQTYEDFLPVSAAGIFQSNLGSDAQSNYDAAANQGAFERELGVAVVDANKLYQSAEDKSLRDALVELGQGHLLDRSANAA